ncbi:unnamed protein product [Rotaria socialis]|uniref:Uncharacterized protein n=1 Tax=Rotaria socialis TaxID=392032 RepID=A0A821T1L8_9BILA|nr:unnamed protein product [Rotaria socialis]CAF3337243.1 unnamed protein product [Rotaria socialis]CAF3406659.1 unnamed protein product [Rotaria socialis]CAF3513645.1 unnamed protein product [Rotaria socialis]CAF3681430.1 unnamed protein product [Rotaria socialis]
MLASGVNVGDNDYSKEIADLRQRHKDCQYQLKMIANQAIQNKKKDAKAHQLEVDYRLKQIAAIEAEMQYLEYMKEQVHRLRLDQQQRK